MTHLQTICPVEEDAVDAIVQIINAAKVKAGCRMNLIQLANSHKHKEALVSLHELGTPLGKCADRFLATTIERDWKLTRTFSYFKRYMGSSVDEVSHYYYYEVVFSQPTVSCPIPQASATVYFRIADKHIFPPDVEVIPLMIFRIEGEHANHDVRFVTLSVDWLLAVIQTKLNIYKRIESYDCL